MKLPLRKPPRPKRCRPGCPACKCAAPCAFGPSKGCVATVQGSLTSGCVPDGVCPVFGVQPLLARRPRRHSGLCRTGAAFFFLSGPAATASASRLPCGSPSSRACSGFRCSLIPFVLPRPWWVGAFLLLTLLSSLLGKRCSQPLWTAWITDLVPEDNRGRYFGRRNMFAGWVGMAVPILGGYFLDAATKTPCPRRPNRVCGDLRLGDTVCLRIAGSGRRKAPTCRSLKHDYVLSLKKVRWLITKPRSPIPISGASSHLSPRWLWRSPLLGSFSPFIRSNFSRPEFHGLAASGGGRDPGVARQHAAVGVSGRQIRQQADFADFLRAGHPAAAAVGAWRCLTASPGCGAMMRAGICGSL